jgi:hypothetical protein
MARKPKQRAIVSYNVAQAEIEQIKEKMRFIELAARTTLPVAMEVGEWFAKQRAKMGQISWSEWEDWIRSKFPEFGLSTIHRYVQLASEKQFLAAKFALAERATDLDFEALPTIKEALEAIKEKNRPIKRGAGRARAKSRTIDVNASVSSGTNGEDYSERATRIVPPAETLADLLEKGERVEHPDAPLNPKQEISADLGQCASCLRAASGFWQQALVIAEHHQIPVSDVQAELREYFSEEPALVMCFTTGFSYGTNSEIQNP